MQLVKETERGLKALKRVSVTHRCPKCGKVSERLHLKGELVRNSCLECNLERNKVVEMEVLSMKQEK